MRLSIWTVYDHPRDYPNSFVARRFTIDEKGVNPTEDIIICDDLETLRTMLLVDMHLTCLPRELNDDPKIVECWI